MEEEILSKLPPEQRIRKEVEKLSPDELSEMLGKNRNKTFEKWGNGKDTWLTLIRKIHGTVMKDWEKSSKANEKKAFKILFP